MKPHDHTDRWDKADVETLQRLYKEKLLVKDIAKQLGRTPGAVTSKLYRLRQGS